MEVTKWLKPSDSASRIGDGASVQADASERRSKLEKDDAQAEPDDPFGEGRHDWVNERENTPSRCAGVAAAARTQGKLYATREAPRRGQR